MGADGRGGITMKLFGNITLEEVVVAFVVAIAATIFVSLSERLGSSSLRWALRFISATRQQRWRDNYVEVRRRIRNDDYLLFKEAHSLRLMHALTILNFGAVLVLLTLGADETAPDVLIMLLLVVLLLMAGALVLVVAVIETTRNDAARAFRAGLRRDRRTRQFGWPPSTSRRDASRHHR
jgi:hypothetical protein